MPATLDDIQEWVASAKKKEVQYLVVVTDTYEWEDYPVYCKDLKELSKALNEYDLKNLQKITEIYDVTKIDDKFNYNPFRGHRYKMLPEGQTIHTIKSMKFD